MTGKQFSVGLVMSNGLLFATVLCFFTPLMTALGIPWVGYTWDNTHGFVVPHLVLSGLLLAFYGFGIAGSVSDRQVRWVSGWVQPVTAGSYLWAMLQWPGGDDGGGLSWGFIVGPITAAALLIAAKSAMDRANSEKGSATIARATFCIVVAIGFGIWVAIPWVNILVDFLRHILVLFLRR